MDTSLPAADPDSPWMKHLEAAHRLAHVAARAVGDEVEPSPHLEPAARQLERGLAAVYDAFDGRADRLTAINLAHSRFWDAAILVARAGLAGALANLRDACGELVGAEERFPLVPLAAPEAAPLRAGVDLPPLHTVARAALTPAFRAPADPRAGRGGARGRAPGAHHLRRAQAGGRGCAPRGRRAGQGPRAARHGPAPWPEETPTGGGAARARAASRLRLHPSPGPHGRGVHPPLGARVLR